MRNSGQIHIRIILEGDLANQFELLKEFRALRNSTELIRQLIREAYLRDFSHNLDFSSIKELEVSKIE